MNKTLIQAATKFFDNYPTQNKCYGTDDGNVFFEKDRSHAANHARERGINYHEITPASLGKEDKPAKTPEPKATPTPPKKEDKPANEGGKGKLKIGKDAAALLKEAKIDPTTIKGTGVGGMITKKDAQEAINAATSAQDTTTESGKVEKTNPAE